MAEGAAGEAPGRAFPRSGKTGVCAKRRPLRGRVEVFEAPTNLGEDPYILELDLDPRRVVHLRLALELWRLDRLEPDRASLREGRSGTDPVGHGAARAAL